MIKKFLVILTMLNGFGQRISLPISKRGYYLSAFFSCFYFAKYRKRLLPKPTDLSYYNWETQLSTSNSSPYYQVIADSAQGLLFKNKRDRKLINVNPDVSPGDNTTRTELETDDYIQVVFYDHTTRRRL